MSIIAFLLAACICVQAITAVSLGKRLEKLKNSVSDEMQRHRKMTQEDVQGAYNLSSDLMSRQSRLEENCKKMEARISALEDAMESYRGRDSLLAGISEILSYNPYQTAEEEAK